MSRDARPTATIGTRTAGASAVAASCATSHNAANGSKSHTRPGGGSASGGAAEAED